MNIYEKMHAIMKNVSYLAKDDKVEFGNTKYKALSEEKVTSIMRKQFVEQKLMVFPIQMEASRSGQISHVDVTYRIVNTENPDEFIEVVSCGDGADSQDKGAGKAMTYAFKYMWLRTFAIPTGEDPDKISSEELDAIQAEEEAKKELASEKDKKMFTDMCEKLEVKPNDICKQAGITGKDFTKEGYAKCMIILGEISDAKSKS